MAQISLREYTREIETLIEQGQTDEAVTHCRNILRFFPKHIETYRLLGKSYLESKRYGDAADILQRVLSSVPDDFVAHIGMSIIREDEGNLDASIWHMERAFDIQPSNVAIQDELRRLYGKRDGLDPPKIRLTRSALARMYAHGHLYSQAIAELRVALATDPRRIDLQVLLARMYHQSKQEVKAAKIASQLVNKLPYCFEVNLILSEILSESHREEEAETYQQRLHELDPYQAYVSQNAPTVDIVPAAAVMLEKVDWETSKAGMPSQPEWATSLGVDISESSPSDESLPDWLATPSEEEPAELSSTPDESVSPLADSFTSEVPEPGSPELSESEPENLLLEASNMENDNIPDWLQEAGWEPREPDALEEPPPKFDFDQSLDDDDSRGGEIAKAEIPEWLRAMAPQDLEEKPELSTDELPGTPEPALEPDVPEWLLGTKGEETPVSSEPDTGEDASLSEDLGTPEWLKDLGGEEVPDDLSRSSPAEAAGDEIPDWLREISPEPPTIEPEPTAPPYPHQKAKFPIGSEN